MEFIYCLFKSLLKTEQQAKVFCLPVCMSFKLLTLSIKMASLIITLEGISSEQQVTTGAGDYLFLWAPLWQSSILMQGTSSQLDTNNNDFENNKPNCFQNAKEPLLHQLKKKVILQCCSLLRYWTVIHVPDTISPIGVHCALTFGAEVFEY